MESIIRATAIYLFFLLMFRIMGKKSLAQITTFDFVLLLIISETTQEGLVGEDYSVTNALIVAATLVMLDLGFALLKRKFHRLERIVDGLPLILVDQGRLLQERLAKTRVDKEDILEAARCHHGLERLDQIKYAVLERSGGISIIPNAG